MALAEDYGPEFGGRILGRFKEGGWNLSLLARAEHIGGEEIISAGPAEQLEVGESYIVYPSAFDPKDAEQVFALGALKKAKTGLCCPVMFIVDRLHPIEAFVTKSMCVVVYPLTEGEIVYIPYIDFVESLDSL